MNKLFSIVLLLTLSAFGFSFLTNEKPIANSENNLSGTDKPDKAATQSKSPCDQFEIPNYNAYRVSKPPTIDGKLDEAVWKSAPQSNRFKDLISGAETIHNTRAAVLWDDEYLYVAYWIEEPNLQASITERDGLI